MINIEKIKECGIDYEAGLKRFMGDADLYEAVLAAFLSVDLLERAKPAFKNRDKESLLGIIHEVKGSSGNAGFTALYTEASVVVSLLRSESYTDDELVEHYNRFEKEYTKIFDGIKSALQ